MSYFPVVVWHEEWEIDLLKKKNTWKKEGNWVKIIKGNLKKPIEHIKQLW